MNIIATAPGAGYCPGVAGARRPVAWSAQTSTGLEVSFTPPNSANGANDATPQSVTIGLRQTEDDPARNAGHLRDHLDGSLPALHREFPQYALSS